MNIRSNILVISIVCLLSGIYTIQPKSIINNNNLPLSLITTQNKSLSLPLADVELMKASNNRGWVFYANEKTFFTHIINTANKYNIDPELFLGLIAQESNYYQYATSSSGAIGLSQLMPATALETCPDLFKNIQSIYSPYDNIECGARYFSIMEKLCNKNTTCALASYNQGSGLTYRNGGKPVTVEAIKYVPAVLRYKDKYDLYLKLKENEDIENI